MYMESRGESVTTQNYVGSVALNLASQDNTSVCKSIQKPRRYSWQWDGKHTKVDTIQLKALEEQAKKLIKKRSLSGYYYFNECKLGKRFKTEKPLVKSGNLCFY